MDEIDQSDAVCQEEAKLNELYFRATETQGLGGQTLTSRPPDFSTDAPMHPAG
jgi:hypothetical protein